MSAPRLACGDQVHRHRIRAARRRYLPNGADRTDTEVLVRTLCGHWAQTNNSVREDRAMSEEVAFCSTCDSRALWRFLVGSGLERGSS